MSRRPLLVAVLAFAAGILAGSGVGVGAGWAVVAAVFGGVLAVFRRREDRANAALVLVAVFLGGWAYCSLRAAVAAGTIGGYAEGPPVELEGVVVSEPRRTGEAWLFVVKARRAMASGRETRASGTVRVALSLAGGTDCPVGYADEVRVYGRLRRPARASNPGQRDQARSLGAKGVRYVMYASAEAVRVTGGRAGSPLTRAGIALRRWTSDAATAGLSAEQGALLAGIMFGARSGVDEELSEAFSRAGVAHITAVSGLHVGFVAAACFSALHLARIRGATAAGAAGLAILVYCAAVGFSASALRAAVMFWAVLAAGVLGRARDSPTALGLAAGVILVGNPFCLFDLGFQLSFAATAGIILLAGRLEGILRPLPGQVRRLAATTTAAQLAVLPLCAAEFNTVSLVAFVVNLFVVPLAGAVVNLGFLCALMRPVAGPLVRVAVEANGFLLNLLGAVVRGAASLPFGYVYLPSPHPATVAAYYAAGGAALGMWLLPGRGPVASRRAGAVALCLVVMAWVAPVALPRRHLEVTFLDVGEGDAIYVGIPGARPLLIDAGGGEEGTAAGGRVVVPFLRSRGVRRLDVVVTHGHDDHAGGVLAVLGSFRVGTAYVSPHAHPSLTYSRLLAEFAARGVLVRELHAGQSVRRGAAEIAVIHPGRSIPAGADAEANNCSVVLLLRYGQVRFVFAGDVEAEGVEEVMAAAADMRACVLKVPHHGSADSFHAPFLQRVSPRYAVISVGENRFGHPGRDWLEALASRGVSVYRTDTAGAVTFSSDGVLVRVRKFRRNQGWPEGTSLGKEY